MAKTYNSQCAFTVYVPAGVMLSFLLASAGIDVFVLQTGRSFELSITSHV